MRYFLIKNIETLEVYLSQDLDEQPENSIPFFENSLKRAVFNHYPNPTSVIDSEVDEVEDDAEQIAVNIIYQIIESNNLDFILVDSNGNTMLPQ